MQRIWTVAKKYNLDVIISTAVSKEIATWIRESAKKQGVKPSQIVRDILETAKASKEKSE